MIWKKEGGLLKMDTLQAIAKRASHREYAKEAIDKELLERLVRENY